MTKAPIKAENKTAKFVLQLCHGYGMPFHDVARQYAALFNGTDYKVMTVFLTGKKNDDVAEFIDSDEVIFLENTSRDIRGLKLKQIDQVRQLCEQYEFAFCIAHRFKPVYIACHVPELFVIGVHHAFGDYNRLARRWFAQSKRNQLVLLGVSDAVRDDIRSYLPRFPSERIQTLYNRIDYRNCSHGLVSRDDARTKLNLPANVKIFANVGRLHSDKDQATLLRAFATVHQEYPDAILVIMGKGQLERDLKNLTEALGLNDHVIFTGAVESAAQYFKAFDSFVLSSDHEPFGMVLLEAMAAGLPMVVCDSGGAPEVCGNTGLLFPLRDAAKLAKRMSSVLLMSEPERIALGVRMEERLREYFTDEASRLTFWNYSFLAPFSRNKSGQ